MVALQYIYKSVSNLPGNEIDVIFYNDKVLGLGKNGFYVNLSKDIHSELETMNLLNIDDFDTLKDMIKDEIKNPNIEINDEDGNVVTQDYYHDTPLVIVNSSINSVKGIKMENYIIEFKSDDRYFYSTISRELLSKIKKKLSKLFSVLNQNISLLVKADGNNNSFTVKAIIIDDQWIKLRDDSSDFKDVDYEELCNIFHSWKIFKINPISNEWSCLFDLRDLMDKKKKGQKGVIVDFPQNKHKK